MGWRTTAAVAGVVLSAAAIAGCGSGTKPDASPGTPRVAIILGGVANDGGFNEAGAAAVEALQREGKISAQIRQSVANARDAETAVREYANAGYNLVIGWSASFSDAVYQVSKEPAFSKTRFLVTGDSSDNQKPAANVETWNYDNTQYGYLLGWIAGNTQLAPIGIIDGQPIPAQVRKWKGFELGVHAVNPAATVRQPIFTGSWEDATKANQAAVAQLDSGAHLIATNAEGFSPGIASAAAARNVATVGMNSATSDTAKKINVGRARLDLLPILRPMIDRLKNGTFGNRTSISTIANKSLVLDTITKVAAAPSLPDDIQARAERLAQQLAGGTVKIGP